MNNLLINNLKDNKVEIGFGEDVRIYWALLWFENPTYIVTDSQGNKFSVLQADKYLTEEQAKSHKEYFKQIGKCTLLSSKGYTYHLQRCAKSYGSTNSFGYKVVCTKGTTTTVNNLVYRTFVSPIEKGFEVHHVNHDKEDNRLSNLACISRADNLRERFVNNPNLGKEMFSNKNSNYIYCESNNTLYKNRATLAKDLNLLISACNKVIEGTWKHYKGYKFRFLTDKEQEKASSFNFFDKGVKMVNISQISL